MDAKLKESKQAIRAFMREHYTDERLAMLLAHAKDGLLSYFSCCCLVGIPTADHALQWSPTGILINVGVDITHLRRGASLPGGWDADYAFAHLGDGDTERRRRLIPMVKAEMRRRSRMLKS